MARAHGRVCNPCASDETDESVGPGPWQTYFKRLRFPTMSPTRTGVPHWRRCTEGGARLGQGTVGTPMYPRTVDLADFESIPFKSDVDLIHH